jgi:hypothetical protein
MRFRVIEAFVDLQDNNHLYQAGDNYPRSGADVSLTRINELASAQNNMGMPLIEEVKEEKEKVVAPKAETKAEAKVEVEEKALTKADIENMPYFTLKAEAKKRGISVDGKKAPALREELIAAL